MIIKRTLSDFCIYYIDHWKCFAKRIRSMDIVSFAESSLSVLLICIAFAFFSGLRKGVADTYMGVFIPLFFADMLIVFFGSAYHSSKTFPIPICFLLTGGLTLQIFMLPVDETINAAANSQIKIVFLGILFAALLVPAVAFVLSKKTRHNRTLALLMTFIFFLYIGLVLFGTTINGSRSWIYLFNSSIHFQITEAVKLVSYLFFSICLASDAISAKKRSRWLFGLLVINSVFMVVINELGTLIVMHLVYFAMRFAFSDGTEKGYIAKEILGLVLVLLSLFLLCFCVYEAKSKAETATVLDTQETRDPIQEITERVALIYPKVVERVHVFLGSSDSQGDGYQREMADQALNRISWFGTPKGTLSKIPEISTDFVFIYFIVRLGVTGMFLLMTALLSIFFEALIESAKPNRMQQEKAMAITLVSSMVIQSLLCASANVGLFPVVGLPFPFLSLGGSSMCINLFTALFLLFFMRESRKEEIECLEAK